MACDFTIKEFSINNVAKITRECQQTLGQRGLLSPINFNKHVNEYVRKKTTLLYAKEKGKRGCCEKTCEHFVHALVRGTFQVDFQVIQ